MPLGMLNWESVKVLPSRLPDGLRLPCTGPPPSVVTVTSARSDEPVARVKTPAQIRARERAKGAALRFRDRKSLVICISQMILFLSLGAGSFHRFCPIVRYCAVVGAPFHVHGFNRPCAHKSGPISRLIVVVG